jgi:hypothetical protein
VENEVPDSIALPVYQKVVYQYNTSFADNANKAHRQASSQITGILE